MKKPYLLLLAFSSLLPLLYSCAGVVVGTAATGAIVIHDRRTTGTIVEDEMIEIKAIKQILLKDELRNHTHININSYNNIVLLTGEAPNQKLRLLAEQIVATLPKVRGIHNEIIIATNSTMLSRSNDAVLTTKIKTGLLQIELPDFDPTRISVTTENAHVFLMGLVYQKEANAVVDYVRKVSGVKKIIKMFEYLD